MVFDPSSQRVIMFGGSNALTSKFYNDTWEYDPVANTWTELRPSGELPAARFTTLVYAPSVGHVIMFGGAGVGDLLLDDTWVFSR